MPEERVVRRLSAIVAMDLVGFSRFMGDDETGTLSRLNALRLSVIDPELAEHTGRLVKTTGDGFLIEFRSAVDAMLFSLSVQRKLEKREADLAETDRLLFRIGINVGDVIIDGEDIFGDGVNIAAKLEGISDPGGIVISASVKEQIDGKVDANFASWGQRELKNISRPVNVWAWKDGTEPDATPNSPTIKLALPEKPSIAVLPFTDMGGETDNGFFADGISEDLITELSR